MKFDKLVVLDRIILLESQWRRLKEFAVEILEYSGLNPTEMLKKIYEEMEQDPKPMCWTQLAQEEVTIEELKNRVKDADAIITCWTSIPDEIILSNSQLKYVGFWTNLAAHRINIDLAKKRRICVTLIPDYGTDSVAELTFAGILAVSRKLFRAHHDTLRGKWPYELIKTGQYVPKVEEIRQRILKDKVIGIVGLGRIGKRVAEIALAFKMKVQYWSKNRHQEFEEKGLKFVSLEELFSTSDIVSVHLSPYAPEGFVKAEYIKGLKDRAIFVNTSAGLLIDQDALFKELSSKRIFAFLDVYEGLPPKNILKNISSLDNIFTYRSGWYTQEAITYKGEYLLKNIERFLKGEGEIQAQRNISHDESIIEIPCSRDKY